jgi:molecular chaperone GrpE
MTEEKNVNQGAKEETPSDSADAAPVAPEDQATPQPDVGDPSADERVQQMAAEMADLKDRSLRALADAENTRRRAQRELNDARKYGASGIIKDLLNVSDNLQRALESVPPHLRDGDEHVKNLVVGVEMVAKDLLNAFEKHGVRKIEPLNEPFNHEVHQAMYEVENTGKPNGTVVEMLQPGYVMHDRLIRPAMVAVAKGDPDGPPENHERVDTTA